MTLIYFILVLSVTVFVHELGHFIFAKKAGIHVYEFSIGMGPKLFKFNRKNDETEYAVRLLPIGGFCSMAGESVDIDEKIPEEKRLQSKTWLQRFLTVVAGILFNFIFAIIILFIVGLIIGNPNNKPIISDVFNDSPAYSSGLQKGDLIKKINGKNINSIDRLMLEYQVDYGKDLNLEVLRNNEIIKITINPLETEEGYSYGFALDNTINKGFLEAIKYSFTKFFSLISQIMLSITYLITGRIGLSNLAGPIGIYSIVGETARAGIINLIYLIGYLSINVGFVNLIPIPAFDGGRLLFLIIEKVRKKPVKASVENTIHAIGMILLMILMFVITCNDIIRLIVK